MTDFMNNAAELQKMNALIRSIRENPDAVITSISITGYASPEGTYAANLSLSAQRAQSLKNFIRDVYGLPENLFTFRGMGEDEMRKVAAWIVDVLHNRGSNMDLGRS